MLCPLCKQKAKESVSYKGVYLCSCTGKLEDISILKKNESQIQQTNNCIVDNLIDEILNEFNFQKVVNVMFFLNWVWAPLGRVPTITDLKKSAKEKLLSSYQSAVKESASEISLSSGGLKATCFLTNNEPILVLEFILEEWTAEV